jgi:uncharacterized protein (TIGR03435 family)
MSPAAKCAVLFLFASHAALSQDTFEVASVKRSVDPAAGLARPVGPAGGPRVSAGWSGGPGTDSPGQLIGRSVSLKSILLRAWSVKNYQVVAPAWLDSERYDIAAKVPPGATREQIPPMLRNLLAERFKLTVHRSTKELPVYALVVAKGGPRLKEAEPGAGAAEPNQPMPRITTGADGFPEFPPGFKRNFILSTPEFVKEWARNQSMEHLAGFLTGLVERPVLDMTGLQGEYEYTLSFRTGSDAAESPGPGLFAALQSQLGLKLDARKAPVEMLIVDHVERTPTGN